MANSYYKYTPKVKDETTINQKHMVVLSKDVVKLIKIHVANFDYKNMRTFIETSCKNQIKRDTDERTTNKTTL